LSGAGSEPDIESGQRRGSGAAVLGWLALTFAVLLAIATVIAWMRAATIDVASLARRNPGSTALMRQREREAIEAGRPWNPVRSWVPYEQISPHLRRAVLIAEDDAFFSHDGLDWNEIRASARRDLQAGRIVRGGSTITQQLAKNLWLGTSRSPMRKLEEVLLAVRLERALGKRRIFELYLNVIEWGDGVFGAEAAAEHWFGVPASELTARESVRLAAVIINPRRFSPLESPRRIEHRVRVIATRMRRRGELDEADWRDVLGLSADTLAGTPTESAGTTPVENSAVVDTLPAPADSLPR
jgi:monofunctional biosynthetic peptidoglycan transglycosylase